MSRHLSREPMLVHRLRHSLWDMNETWPQDLGLANLAGRLGEMLAVAVAGVVLGAIAPRHLASVSSLRRAAMVSYLAGCGLMVLAAMQATPDGLGLAVVILPLAAATLTLAIGCHARLRDKGADLVTPES